MSISPKKPARAEFIPKPRELRPPPADPSPAPPLVPKPKPLGPIAPPVPLPKSVALPRPNRPRIESALGGPKDAAKPAWQLPVTLSRPAVPVRPPGRKPAAPARPEQSEVAPGPSEPAKVATPEGVRPVVSDRLAAALVDLPELNAAATAAAIREAKEKAAREQPWWVRTSVRDSLRNARARAQRLGAWWHQWRTGASFRVLLAFVAIYSLLAFMRAPSEAVIEQARYAEEIAFLQGFLRSYATAGGVVLARRPHGGAELFPRGVVLKGEVLEAFLRAEPGAVFVVHTTLPESNPLSGFYGFPPIYAGGSYFHLERTFNFSRYRCSYLIRKEFERSGSMLLARVELAD